ncbi:MAG: Gfo/Idh/MocA family oxidoreductase [Patescibacteria group bacterium]
MRVGLIGFGSIGQRHYNNIKKYTNDIVILSKRKDIGNSMVVNNWFNFSAHAPFDSIFVTNETHKHIPTIRKCLGLNPGAIFVEKPISHNSNGLGALAKLLKKENISLFVGYNFHFFKPLIKIKEIIKSNKIGKIYYLRVTVGQDLREWRNRDYRFNYAVSKKTGGGVMLDLIHEINYAGWLLNEKLIPKTALIKKVSDLKINTEDCADSLFVSKNGTIVSIHQDYLRIPLRRGLEIVGSKGSLTWDYTDNIISWQIKDKVFKQKITVERNEMFKDELKYFFDLLRKKKFFTNIDEAIKDIKNIEYLKKHAK